MTKLIHRAHIYDQDEDFLKTAVPFVREGLDAGEAVLAVSTASNIADLRTALGTAADWVRFGDSASWYERPSRTIAAYNSFIAENATARIRVLAEPGWERGTPVEISEWTRYEAIVNDAFAEIQASVLCLYHRHDSAPGMIDGALCSHPELVDETGTRHNDAYLDPDALCAHVDRHPLAPPPSDAVTIPIDSIDLSLARAFIGGHARDHGIGPARLNDLLVTVTEVATNAIRHGFPPVECRMWADDTDIVVDVTDAGVWKPGSMAGFVPPDPVSRSGFGLWGVRMLCALVQIRTDCPGTTVRLRVPLR